MDDPILAPIQTAANDLKLMTALWMKRVRDAHFDADRIHTACS